MNTSPKKSNLQTEDKYIVRFPNGMRDRISEEAKKNGRSMNAEIIHVLSAYYKNIDALNVLSTSGTEKSDIRDEIRAASAAAITSVINEVLEKHGLLEAFNSESEKNKI